MDKTIDKYEELSEKFKSISHPVRLKILDMLCNCGSSKLKVKTIYEKLDIDQPSISRHLNIMRKSGVLQRIQEGSNTFYCLCTDDSHVDCIKKCFI